MKDKYDKILDRILKIGKVIQFLLFLCVCVFVMFTVRCGTEKVDRYKAYLCYDYHLAASDTSDKIGKYKDDPTVTGENTFYYYKIKGESLDHFVETEVVRGVLFPSHRRYVLQNPEKYVNIRKDWSIKEIQISLPDGPSVTLDKKTHGDFIDGIYDLINSDQPSLHPSPIITPSSLPIFELQIIIIFDESDTIVWQTEIIILDTDGKRYIEIEIGARVDLIEEKKSSCYIEIDTESEVYRVLSDVFDELQA